MELPNRPTKDPYQEIPVKDFSYINTQKKLPKEGGRRLVLIVVGLIVLVLLGGGAFLYGHYTKGKTAKSKATTTHKSVTSKATAPSIPLTSYSSSIFNFTVNYPKSWAVSSEGNDSQTITSPEMSLTADTGNTVEGKIIVNFFNQGQIPAAFGSTSVAVLNSQDVTFTQATTAQAAQTYISFVQYPATTVIGGLDAIYVTGNDGYLKGQNIPSSDVGQVSPLILVDFQRCANQACTSPTNLTISSNMWNNLNFSTPILDIIKSLSFLPSSGSTTSASTTN